ncbi:MAG: IPT/TIG domain-containing protein, partial [Opitutaceae bacterium]|nr:IPT/TIG domain-containing protein [Opitutaceae bacterium]
MRNIITSVMLLAVFPSAARAQTAGLEDSPPAAANIVQPVVYNTSGTSTAEITEGTQARYLNATDYRAVSQTFTWRGDRNLTGVGIRVAPDQNTPGGNTYTAGDQLWALDVQELDATRKVVSTLVSATVTISPAHVQPDKYINITLAAPLPLVNGGVYGFRIRPAEIKNNRILVATSGSSAPWSTLNTQYAGTGRGNQTGGFHPEGDAVNYGPSPEGTEYSGSQSISFYTTCDAPAATDFASDAIIKRVVYSEPNTYFTYPHENGFRRENGGSGDWVLVVAQYQNDSKLRLDQFNPNPPAPVTKQLLLTEGMRLYYAVSENGGGSVCYTQQAGSGGAVPARVREGVLGPLDNGPVYGSAAAGFLGTGSNRLVYEGPAGWQISQTVNLANDASASFARIYNINDNTDGRILKIDNATGAAETLLVPEFATDHVHCSPFDNDWVMFSNATDDRTLSRIWAWHAAEAPAGVQLFVQKSADDRDLYTGHERALFNNRSAVTVVYPGSSGTPRGLYEIGFDRSFRVASPDADRRDWHCNISRDGRWAVVDTQEAGGVSRIVAVNFTTGARQVLCRTSATDHPWHPHPHISPDNKWVVFNDANLKKVVALEIDPDWLAAFAAAAPPVISEIYPSTVVSGGLIKIRGANFINVTGLKFGGVAAAGVLVNDVRTEITAILPGGAPASGGVSLVAENGADSVAAGYTIADIPPPAISGFTPEDAAAGQTIVINGANFTGVMTVRFGGVDAPRFTVNPEETQITVTVPPGIPDGAPITV